MNKFLYDIVKSEYDFIISKFCNFCEFPRSCYRCRHGKRLEDILYVFSLFNNGGK